MPDEPTAESEHWPDDEWDDREPSEPVESADDGFNDRFDDFMGDRSGDEFEHGPDAGGSKGRILVGIALLVIGVIVAVIAVQSLGDDDGDSNASKTDVKSATTTAAEETTTTAAPTIVPTTIPGGALPTGCGTWDHAFDVAPESFDGVSIYSDFDGWHVRLAPDGPESITGTVTGQTMPTVSDAPLPEGTEITELPEGATIAFRVTAGEEPVGFDFEVTCEQKQLVFALNGPDGAPLDPADVRVGMQGEVAELPVVAQRTPPPNG